MLKLVRSKFEDEILHEFEALRIHAEKTPKLSLKMEELDDWYRALHYLDRRVANEVIGALEKNDEEGLIISEVNLHHLEHITVEIYKSMLAYHNWEKDGKVVNNDRGRIIHDWTNGCGFLDNYLKKTSPAKCTKAVTAYFKKACGPDKDKIKQVKAYCLFLTFGRDPATNYNSASRFVDDFYQEDLIMSVLSGNKSSQGRIRELLSPKNSNEHFEIHAMANMVEANIFRIKDIVPS